MKRLFLLATLVTAALFSDAFVAFSQNKSGVVTASSMIVTRTKIKKEKDPVEIRWQNNIEASVSTYYGVSYTGGWRFGNFLFLGFGAGVHVHPNVVPWDDNDRIEIWSFSMPSDDIPDKIKDSYNADYFVGGDYAASRISVPLYVNARFRFTKGRVAPYLSASGGLMLQGTSYGYNLGNGYYDSDYGYYDIDFYEYGGVEGKYYANIQVGADIRLKNHSSMFLGYGVMLNGHDDSPLYHEYYDTTVLGCITLGVSF